MTYRLFGLIGLLLFLPLSPPAPAHGREIWEGLQRQRRRQESDRQWERLNQPRSAPSQSNMEGNEEGVQEIHGAVTREACREMAANFRRQGRKIKLVRIDKSTNPGATLQYNCIFEGEDAQAGWFDERRY